MVIQLICLATNFSFKIKYQFFDIKIFNEYLYNSGCFTFSIFFLFSNNTAYFIIHLFIKQFCYGFLSFLVIVIFNFDYLFRFAITFLLRNGNSMVLNSIYKSFVNRIFSKQLKLSFPNILIILYLKPNYFQFLLFYLKILSSYLELRILKVILNLEGIKYLLTRILDLEGLIRQYINSLLITFSNISGLTNLIILNSLYQNLILYIIIRIVAKVMLL